MKGQTQNLLEITNNTSLGRDAARILESSLLESRLFVSKSRTMYLTSLEDTEPHRRTSIALKLSFSVSISICTVSHRALTSSIKVLALVLFTYIFSPQSSIFNPLLEEIDSYIASQRRQRGASASLN